MRGFFAFSSRSCSHAIRTVKRAYAPCILTRLPILLSVRVCMCMRVCVYVWLAGWLVVYFIVYLSFQHSRLLFSFVCVSKKVQASVSTTVNYFTYFILFSFSFAASFRWARLQHTHMNVDVIELQTLYESTTTYSYGCERAHTHWWNRVVAFRSVCVCTLLYYSQQINSC